MEPVMLVQRNDYVALVCESPTGAPYLIDGEGVMTLFTPRLQKKFTLINWDRRKATQIAKKHNSYSGKMLRVDLSSL